MFSLFPNHSAAATISLFMPAVQAQEFRHVLAGTSRRPVRGRPAVHTLVEDQIRIVSDQRLGLSNSPFEAALCKGSTVTNTSVYQIIQIWSGAPLQDSQIPILSTSPTPISSWRRS